MPEMLRGGGLVEPTKGFEPSTYSLRYCRSTVELGRHKESCIEFDPNAGFEWISLLTGLGHRCGLVHHRLCYNY